MNDKIEVQMSLVDTIIAVTDYNIPNYSVLRMFRCQGLEMKFIN